MYIQKLSRQCLSGCRHLMGFRKHVVYHILFYKTEISHVTLVL
jgi:hypothetical protein